MCSEIGSERCKDWGAAGLGGVFSVEWIHKESISFQFTHQLLNPWNDNKKVQISRDGQVGHGQARSWFLISNRSLQILRRWSVRQQCYISS